MTEAQFDVLVRSFFGSHYLVSFERGEVTVQLTRDFPESTIDDFLVAIEQRGRAGVLVRVLRPGEGHPIRRMHLGHEEILKLRELAHRVAPDSPCYYCGSTKRHIGGCPITDVEQEWLEKPRPVGSELAVASRLFVNGSPVVANPCRVVEYDPRDVKVSLIGDDGREVTLVPFDPAEPQLRDANDWDSVRGALESVDLYVDDGDADFDEDDAEFDE